MKNCLLILCLFLGVIVRAQPGSYLVTDFKEDEFGNVLELCHEGGFEYVLHRYPFSSYGHYQWNPDFVAQERQVAKLVQTAEAEGIHLGVLVHEDAVSLNDAFFVPRYYKQLLRQGEVRLFDDLSAGQVDFAVYKTEVLNHPSTLNLLLIDDELISYGTMEPAGDLMLLHQCKRGIYGTKTQAHSRKTPAFKLADSPERYVFPDGSLKDAVQQQLEERIKATGITFVEYASSPGHELVNENQRVQNVERWEKEREQANGNQPMMLGWFRVHVTDSRLRSTTIEEMEWLLSKAVAFDANYGLLIGRVVMRNYGQIHRIMGLAKNWGLLGKSGLLNEYQKELLKDPYLNWHLETDENQGFKLYQLNVSRRHLCPMKADLLGLPISDSWIWKSEEGGRFGIRIHVAGKGEIANPTFSVGGEELRFPCVLKGDQSLVYDFDSVAFVMDMNYNTIETVVPEGNAVMSPGENEVVFTYYPAKGKRQPEVTVRYLTRSLILINDEEMR